MKQNKITIHKMPLDDSKCKHLAHAACICRPVKQLTKKLTIFRHKIVGTGKDQWTLKLV